MDVRIELAVRLDGQDAVTLELRKLRGLRPGAPNTFDLITQDQILARLDGEMAGREMTRIIA